MERIMPLLVSSNIPLDSPCRFCHSTNHVGLTQACPNNILLHTQRYSPQLLQICKVNCNSAKMHELVNLFHV